MKSELSLRIKPELDELYKSVGKVKKSLEIDLSEGIASVTYALSSGLVLTYKTTILSLKTPPL